MTSQEVKEITKAINNISAGLKPVLTALNENVMDCAASLRKLNSALESNGSQNDDFWHPVYGDDAELPGKEYDLVLVKVRHLGIANRYVDNNPHIAKLRDDGLWWNSDVGKPYGKSNCDMNIDILPFEVIMWRPIPGDRATFLYADDNIIDSYHEYN